MLDKNKRLLIEELLRRKSQEIYRKDPIRWLVDKFNEDERSFRWSLFPEYKKHNWDGSVDPLANAWQEISKGNWVAVSAATGTSKTYFLSRLVFWFLDCFPDSLVVTSAPKEAQLKLHLWSEIGRAFDQFKKIRPTATLTSLKLSLGGGHDSENPYDGHQAVGFVAGTGADEQSATKAQGFHRRYMLIITEETPGMDAAVMTAFQNTCMIDDEFLNVICAVGNPDSSLDELSQFSELSRVKSFRISAFDYPNVVIGRSVFPGAVTRSSIEMRRDKYGDNSPMFNSRVRGISPKQGADSLIKMDWLERALDLQVEEDLYYYNAAGVDVANSENGDEAAVAYGQGSYLVSIKEFKCPSASDISYNLIYTKFDLMKIRAQVLNNKDELQQYRTKRDHISPKDTDLSSSEIFRIYDIDTLNDYDISPENVGIDTVGVGASTYNTFVNLGYKPTSLQGGFWTEAIPQDEEGKPMYKFSNLRAQMYWELANDLQKGKISISTKSIPKEMIQRLFKELCVIRYEVRENAITIEKKDKIIKRLGKSPNLADCMVYWNWMRKGYRVRNYGELPISAGE